MNAITHKQFSQLRNCKTSFNDIYWAFLNTNIAPQRWSDIVSRYNILKTTHIFHIVTYLYKIYIKSSFNKSSIITPSTITPSIITPSIITPSIITPTIITPTIITPKLTTTKSVPSVHSVPKSVHSVPASVHKSVPSVPASVVDSVPGGVPKSVPSVPASVVIKQKFTGAIRHTTLANYKEWAKSQRSFNTTHKVTNATFAEWKLFDKFHSYSYNPGTPWFNYIDLHMI